MQIFFRKQFSKVLDRLPAKDQNRVQQRLELFIHEPFHPQLRNHPLKGSLIGFRSIDIKPDLRAIYREIGDQGVEFYCLGSHSQLYK